MQFDYARYYQKDYYLDNDGPGAYGYAETGTWLNSTLTGWTVASPTRYATCGSAGNTAKWTPNIHTAGNLQAYVWNVVNSNSDTNARYDLTSAGRRHVCQRHDRQLRLGPLGTHAFAAGTGGSIKLAFSGSGCARPTR